jgi:hypothetical protein
MGSCDSVLQKVRLEAMDADGELERIADEISAFINPEFHTSYSLLECLLS